MNCLYLLQEYDTWFKEETQGNIEEEPSFFKNFKQVDKIEDADIIYSRGDCISPLTPMLKNLGDFKNQDKIIVSRKRQTIPGLIEMQESDYYLYVNEWIHRKIITYQRSLEHDFLETGYSFYQDTMAMQSILTFPIFSRFFRTIGHQVAQIVELGSNQGGLAVYFHDYSKRNNAQFVTFDIHETPINLERWNVDYRKKDVFLEETIQEIGQILSKPGTSILFCDNGYKIQEYKTYAKFLKPGDFIFCHDYARDLDEFSNKIQGRFWNWFEVKESDIAETARIHGLVDFFPEFQQCAISCKVKNKPLMKLVEIKDMPDLKLYGIKPFNKKIYQEPIQKTIRPIPRKNITFVTAMFDLGRGKINNNFKRSFDHYLECFNKLLSMDYPMVIYTEPSLEKWVSDRRKKHSKIITISLDYFRNLEYYSDIQSIRNNPKWQEISGWLKDSPQSSMELYNPFNSRKLPWLSEQAKSNPFQTQYFFWIDGGIANTLSMDYLDQIRYSEPYLDKFLFLSYPYIPSQEIHGFKKEAMADWCKVDLTTRVCRAGFFGG